MIIKELFLLNIFSNLSAGYLKNEKYLILNLNFYENEKLNLNFEEKNTKQYVVYIFFI